MPTTVGSIFPTNPATGNPAAADYATTAGSATTVTGAVSASQISGVLDASKGGTGVNNGANTLTLSATFSGVIANDAQVVHLAGAEDITGPKTAKADFTISKTAPTQIFTSTTSTVGGQVGDLSFRGNNAAAAQRNYARLAASIQANGAGVERGKLSMLALENGTETEYFSSNAFLQANQASKPIISATQEGFFAYRNATLANAIGGSVLVLLTMDVAQYNVGSGYNTGTGTFTVPANRGGRWTFSAYISMAALAGGNSQASAYFTRSNLSIGTYYFPFFRGNIGAIRAPDNTACIIGTMILDLQAGDTVQLGVTSNGAAAISLVGASQPWTATTTQASWFSGYFLG